MSRLNVDILSFAEIGGVGEMIYHTVKFPEYELKYVDGKGLFYPRFNEIIRPQQQINYSLTGQELLISLCNLFKKINDPLSKESFTDLIADWCKQNTHPYYIDDLYDMMSDKDFDWEHFGFLLEKDGIFALDDFMRELSYVYHTFLFHYAIQELLVNNPEPAKNLYYEGKFFDGFPFFEKYKHAPLNENHLEKIRAFWGDEDLEAPSEKSPIDDMDNIKATLISLFPEFKMKLKVHPRTKDIIYAADVQSVFDICWYTLSRLVSDDSPPLDDNFSEGSILSCICCGDFFTRKSSTQKYCSDPYCQAERKRKNNRDSYKNRKLKNIR